MASEIKRQFGQIPVHIESREDKAPLQWKPKLLTFKDALELSDFGAIKSDLEFSKGCFEVLSSRSHGVPSITSLGACSVGHQYFNDWCMFVSGAIYYRRCFKDGARRWLPALQISEKLGCEAGRLHKELMEITSRYVAHPVNSMHIHAATVHVAEDENGELRVGGIGATSSEIAPFTAEGYEGLANLVDRIVSELVDPRIEVLKKKVQELIEGMSENEIRSLPEGFAPVIDEETALRRRNWPKN